MSSNYWLQQAIYTRYMQDFNVEVTDKKLFLYILYYDINENVKVYIARYYRGLRITPLLHDIL